MLPLRALLFDLDDTLYPECEYVRSGFRAVSQWAAQSMHVPKKATFDALCQLFESGARKDTFDQWLKSIGRDGSEWLPSLLDVYHNHAPRISPYPEVPGVLGKLSRKMSLGLVSDGVLATQEKKLDALGLRRYFDCVVFADAWGRSFWKPCTRAFEEALRRLEVAASATVYVADNPLKDFSGARQLGIATVRVRRADGLYSDQEPEGPEGRPDAEIASLLDLERCLAEMTASVSREKQGRGAGRSSRAIFR
jgi:putative hydrolase of the HAD superfamily